MKGYLNALAQGDAATALSYSTDQPGSKDLLSDEILKRQIARWPITNIRILDDSTHGFGFGYVNVAAKFGETESDVTLSLKKSGGEWKLEHAAIKVDTLAAGLDNEALNTLTFFDRSVGSSPVYVFPGFIATSSSNPNLSVKMKKPFLLDALASASGSYFNDVEFTLSDSGQSEVMSAVSAALAGCARSTGFRRRAVRNTLSTPMLLTDRLHGVRRTRAR
ncbi:hypothetical protein A5634_25215 [Mycobacterium asiaticum]|uniref:Uncharacterized protein n=1 Tax=Mycobacterium asiaticum TaxID=1790 RepID=A0A1A3NVL2_MYCAS|nr:hypothetical protein A5634_25215 [Mycobacterium asiaticum]